MKIDFQKLNAELLRRAVYLLPDWLPGGRFEGPEYCCANVSGGRGSSLKYNTEVGFGKDFATGEGFGDMINLYAYIKGLKQGEAAKQLAEQFMLNITPETTGAPVTSVKTPPPPKPPPDLVKPPRPAEKHEFSHFRHGDPARVWAYHDAQGDELFYVLRYETAEGKTFAPLSWSESKQAFVNKAWPDNRPLMGLPDLQARPDAPVLIVEGEKSRDAAMKIAGHIYVVMTWQGGSNAFAKTDWSVLSGRKVLIWPDRDFQVAKTERQANEFGVEIGEVIPYQYQPGTKAAAGIAQIIYKYAAEIKVINVETDHYDIEGFDAHDAVDKLAWGWSEFSQWARKNVAVTKKLGDSVAPPTAPAPIVEVVAEPEYQDAPQFAEPMPTEQDAPPSTTYNVLAIGDDAVETLVPSEVPRSLAVLYDEAGLTRGSNGQPHTNALNVINILRWAPQYRDSIWYDEFHKMILYRPKPDAEPRQWTEVDDLNLMIYLQSHFQLHKISKNPVIEAVISYANANVKNEPRDWLDSLVWDQTPRINDFFTRAMHIEPSAYVSAVGKNFWVSMVARIYKPGCKADEMVILEGLQGCLKSTSLEIIGGKFYGKVSEDLGTKDFAQALAGKMLMEMDELDRFGKAAETTIKMILSASKDRYRPSYGRLTQDFNRTNIFVGSTNDDEYLKDSTGGRRFWPLKIPNGKICDVEYIRENRDQLFAEAVHRFKQGENWYEVPTEQAKEQQLARLYVDDLTQTVSNWLEGGIVNGQQQFKRNEATLVEVFVGSVGGDPERFDMRTQFRFGRIMKALGWSKRNVRRDKIKINVWFRDGESPNGTDATRSRDVDGLNKDTEQHTKCIYTLYNHASQIPGAGDSFRGST